MDIHSHNPRSVPLQPDNESQNPADKSSPISGQVESTLRPRPPHLTWSHRREVGKDQSPEDLIIGTGFSSSGPVSPVSPISSEVLRTPNVSDRPRYSYKHPSTPGATSPLHNRLHSPASQIFERDVQEDILPTQTSPSIPAHIRTENYIPPVLEASSAAITDEQLDPDSVEIVTHSLHQPAAVGVTGLSTAEQSLASSGIVDHDGTHASDTDEVSSAYGALDTHDVRRLSFISFADVVNAEHAESGESSMYCRELSQGTAVSGSSFAAGLQNRSPSPLRSPASSHGPGTSPPTSIATSFKGLEMSPSQGPRAPASPLAMAQSLVSPGYGGELNVETMRQALRKTTSGDLGGIANQTFGNEELLDQSF
ncbi:hypothetical protein N7490_009355 [Penicillium lividum]|nr:hypothetical protein N7490_009355 [Penicillium lividum]